MLEIVTCAVWLSRQKDRDPSHLAVALLLSLAVGGCAGLALATGETGELFAMLWPVLILPGVSVLVALAWRPLWGADALQPVCCPLCGKSAPLIPYRCYRITGALLIMFIYCDRGWACQPCAQSVLRRSIGHNLALGWWAGAAIPINIGFLVANGAVAARVQLRAPGTSYQDRVAIDALAEHEDYARCMLATKDEETVLEVMVERTGLAPRSVRAWLRAQQERDHDSPGAPRG